MKSLKLQPCGSGMTERMFAANNAAVVPNGSRKTSGPRKESRPYYNASETAGTGRFSCTSTTWKANGDLCTAAAAIKIKTTYDVNRQRQEFGE